jgi:tetratricopeptide (TPR) repeat protein
MAHARLWSGNESLNRRVAGRAVERLEPFGESADLAFALFVLGRQLIERGEVDEAEPLLRRARGIAGRVGDRRTETNATISLGWTLQARRRGEETVRLFDEALEAARSAGDLSLLLDALEAVLSAAIEVKGDYSRAETLCREAIQIAKRSGNLQKLARTQLNLAYLLGEMGRLEEATAPLEVSLAAATEVGDPTVIGSINGVIAMHRCLQGRLDDAQRAFEARQVVFDGAKLGPITYVEEFDGLILGYLASGRGYDLEAAEALAAANRRVSDARLSVWEGQILLFECIRAFVRLGRLEEATVVRGRLAGLALANVPPRAFLAWADGLLDPDPGRARDLLAEAAARLEALGRRVDLGRCLLDLAAAEERLGNKAGQLVERGRGLLNACGAMLFLGHPEGGTD